MAIAYPLTFPVAAKPTQYSLGYRTNVMTYSSPETFQTSVYEKVGKAWTLKLMVVPQNIDQHRLMTAFLASLKGPFGTFKFYPMKPMLLIATNKTIAAHSTLRSNLTLNDVADLTVGDYMRVGTQLIQILNISGNSIDIFPTLRADSVGATVYSSDIYGVFRLTANEQEWTLNSNHNADFSLDAIEAV